MCQSVMNPKLVQGSAGVEGTQILQVTEYPTTELKACLKQCNSGPLFVIDNLFYGILCEVSQCKKISKFRKHSLCFPFLFRDVLQY